MAIAGVSANRLELLQIADSVAREKTIDRKIVIEAMEDAIQKAAKSRYGAENDIRCEIDPKTGETRLSRVMAVVEEVENELTQITLADAKRRNPDAKIGDFIAESLPPLDFGRVAAQNAKQVIVQKVREAERERQYGEYKDRVGEIINGTVKRVEYGNVIVDLGRAEGVIRRDEMIPRELPRYGDRIRSYIYDVRREPRGPQIFLSRARPEFMSKLFAMEVPEIYDNVVEIKSVARDPGSRAKIAVISKDSSIDPVGACVGMRGARVQAVVNELQGEKVDIIQWNPDAASFIVNALAPAEVSKVVLDEDASRIEVVVPEAQLSLAIGRRGQNVRLASQLTGWDIEKTPDFHGPAFDEIGDNCRALGHFRDLVTSGRLFIDNPLTPETFATQMQERIAILSAEGPRGRAILFSPHPEMGDLLAKYMLMESYIPHYLPIRGAQVMQETLTAARADESRAFLLILNAMEMMADGARAVTAGATPVEISQAAGAAAKLDALAGAWRARSKLLMPSEGGMGELERFVLAGLEMRLPMAVERLGAVLGDLARAGHDGPRLAASFAAIADDALASWQAPTKRRPAELLLELELALLLIEAWASQGELHVLIERHS